MKILIHGINYSPELTGIGKYSGEMAEWLAERGHEVRVVTAPPYYPEWRIAEGYSGWCYRRETFPDVKFDKVSGHSTESPNWSAEENLSHRNGELIFWRCPLWVPERPSGIKRLLHLASFVLSSFPVMLRQIFWKPDVVMVIEPALMCAPTALMVARLCGAKSWLHIQDFEVDAAFDMGILPAGKLRNWVLRIEAGLMRSFERVSTISQNMLSRVKEKGVEPERILLFPNWVDTNTIFPLHGVNSLRKKLGIPTDAIVALYSGNMGEKQGLEVVLDAALGLTEFSHIRFVMCGDGAVRNRLMQTYGSLPNVLWIPLQPLNRLNELLNMADIHLLPQREDVADLVMPSKLTGMLASGCPIVATAKASTQVARVVSTCGVVSQPGNVAEFMRSVLRLAMDSDLRVEYGKKARMYAIEYLDQQAILNCFEKDLKIAITK